MSGVRTRAAAFLLVLGLLAAGCGSHPRVGPGQARVEDLSGTVRVAESGATHGLRAVRNGEILRAGDRVRVGSGFLVLRFATARVELRGDGQAVLESSGLRLESGRVLVDDPGRLSVTVGHVSAVSGGGIWRMDRDLSVRLGVYQGSVRVESPGTEQLEVGRLRQIVAAGEVVPRVNEPLRLNGSDNWDRRLLGGALRLDEDLAGVAEGFDRQFQAVRVAPAFFVPFVPESRASVVTAAWVTPASVKSEALFALVCARLVAARHQVSFDEALSRVTSLRAQRASWGIVAADQSLDPDAVLAAVREAVNRPPTLVASRPAVAAPPASSPTEETRKPGSSPSPSPSSSPSPSPGTTDLLDTVVGLLGGTAGMLGGLLGPSPSPS